ncbi:MAG: MmgE/PrpD family protein [Pseudomonadota bacterium]
MSPSGPERTLARFTADLAFDAVPQPVRARARHHILDATGIAFAAGTQDFAHRTLTGLVGLSGSGRAKVFGQPWRLPVRDAAMANGFLCHGLDFDDTHLEGVVHPTAAIWPAALAAALHAGADGRALLAGYVLGVEASVRLGASASGRFHAAGWHPTGVVNTFAAALACGRIMDLTEEQLIHAQGIALSMAGGSLEFLADGAWNKRLHPGWAAMAGLTAASLAKTGFQGISHPYDGRFGLYAMLLGEQADTADPAGALADLGERWSLLDTAIKPYPACHFTHGCIEAGLRLAERFADHPDRIARITALVPQEVVAVVCEPVAAKRRPQNGYDAQFSIPFLVAAAILRGRVGLQEIEPAALADEAILQLADRIDYAIDPESGFPRHYSGELVVDLAGGGSLRERVPINLGAADRPLGEADIVTKFRGNMALAVGTERAERVMAALLALDRVGPDVLDALL